MHLFYLWAPLWDVIPQVVAKKVILPVVNHQFLPVMIVLAVANDKAILPVAEEADKAVEAANPADPPTAVLLKAEKVDKPPTTGPIVKKI